MKRVLWRVVLKNGISLTVLGSEYPPTRGRGSISQSELAELKETNTLPHDTLFNATILEDDIAATGMIGYLRE